MSYKNLKGEIVLWIQRLQQYNFRAPARPETQQCRRPFATTMPRAVHPLPQSRSVDTHQTGTRYFGCSHNHLGSRSSQNRTEQSGYRAHFGGSRYRTAPRVEIHRRPQPHVQTLLSPVEIPRCEEWYSRAPLEILRRKIKNNPDSSPSEQSE
jgi:hypothetical protein